MTIPDEIMDQVVQIVLAGDPLRAIASERYLDSLRIPELVLVCESAVAGYLAGDSPVTGSGFPGDLAIKAAAFTRCRAEPERFPRIGTASAVSVVAFFDSLTSRHQWLVHEAMVMGFVLGERYRPVRREETTLPTDEAIVHSVVQHCQSTSDIYPVIGEDVTGLVWKIVKNNPGRATKAAIVGVVASLLPGRRDIAADAVAVMLDDGRLIDTPDGLTIAQFADTEDEG